MKINEKKAFTMAEALTVVVLIGTVAAISMSSFFHHFRENELRTKIRKSVALYESVYKRLAVVNNCMNDGCMTNLTCNDIRREFKHIAEDNRDGGCYLLSSENIWWDVTNINRPRIGKARNINAFINNINANNGNTYTLFGNIQNGVLRINDASSINDAEQQDYESLNNFIRR